MQYAPLLVDRRHSSRCLFSRTLLRSVSYRPRRSPRRRQPDPILADLKTTADGRVGDVTSTTGIPRPPSLRIDRQAFRARPPSWPAPSANSSWNPSSIKTASRIAGRAGVFTATEMHGMGPKLAERVGTTASSLDTDRSSIVHRSESFREIARQSGPANRRRVSRQSWSDNVFRKLGTGLGRGRRCSLDRQWKRSSWIAEAAAHTSRLTGRPISVAVQRRPVEKMQGQMPSQMTKVCPLVDLQDPSYAGGIRFAPTERWLQLATVVLRRFVFGCTNTVVHARRTGCNWSSIRTAAKIWRPVRVFKNVAVPHD